MESPGSPAGGGSSVSDVLAGALPGILKRGRVIVSPYPFGLSDDDNMRITVVNSVNNLTVNIHTRRVLRDQSTTADTPSFTPTADRTPTSFDVPLAGGYVTNLSVFASGASVLKGQCFVIVQMIRGLGVSATLLGTLLAGYITTTQPVGWPGSPIESSTDAEPVIRDIVGTDPAPGAGWSETVPTGARWELVSFGGIVNPVAGGFTGFVNLTILDPAGFTQYLLQPQQQLNATLTLGTMFFAEGYNTSSTATSIFVTACLPERLILLAGSKILGTSSPNWDFDAPHYKVREWQEAG